MVFFNEILGGVFLVLVAVLALLSYGRGKIPGLYDLCSSSSNLISKPTIDPSRLSTAVSCLTSIPQSSPPNRSISRDPTHSAWECHHPLWHRSTTLQAALPPKPGKKAKYTLLCLQAPDESHISQTNERVYANVKALYQNYQSQR